MRPRDDALQRASRRVRGLAQSHKLFAEFIEQAGMKRRAASFIRRAHICLIAVRFDDQINRTSCKCSRLPSGRSAICRSRFMRAALECKASGGLRCLSFKDSSERT